MKTVSPLRLRGAHTVELITVSNTNRAHSIKIDEEVVLNSNWAKKGTGLDYLCQGGTNDSLPCKLGSRIQPHGRKPVTNIGG